MSDEKQRANARFECLTPILNVSDMQASLDHFTQKLGFDVEWRWGEPTGFACVSRDGVELFLCENAQGGGSVWISIFVDDVDLLHKEYRERGVDIVQPPTNFPWGVREMNVRDPDGHRFRFGSESTAPSDGVSLLEE